MDPNAGAEEEAGGKFGVEAGVKAASALFGEEGPTDDADTADVIEVAGATERQLPL